MVRKAAEVSNEEILEIIDEVKSGFHVSLSYLGRKHNICRETISLWVKLEKSGELYEYLLKREEKQKELSLAEKMEKYELEYSPFKYDKKIMTFYRKELKIGDNILLDFETIDKEIAKLQGFLFSDEFKKEYGRDYNIVDLYLTTNLSVKDILDNYIGFMDKVTQKRFLTFVSKQIMRVDNVTIFNNWLSNSRSSLYSRFQRPAQKRIYQMLNLDFLLFNNIRVCKQDIYKTHEILLDLNEKYGVKYDEISFYYILDAYVKNYVETYYNLGEKYKAELDEVTHVQKRENPTLTRRENNSELFYK